MRPLVLLSNDDGYASAGIRAMRAALAEEADVVLLAPETEQSASSHSLSLHRPLRLRAVEPGDLRPRRHPGRLRVRRAARRAARAARGGRTSSSRGINHGMNLGQDAFYSGTVAAAREGALRGIPAVATSAHARGRPRRRGRRSARASRSALLAEHPASGTLLNVNIPRALDGRGARDAPRRAHLRGGRRLPPGPARPRVPVARRPRRAPRARRRAPTPTRTTTAPPRSRRSLLDLTGRRRARRSPSRSSTRIAAGGA